MNLAEYSGRSMLSLAYRDRWRGYRYVPMPGEREYRDMLTYLVYGQHPEVTVRGVRYSGRRGARAPRVGGCRESPTSSRRSPASMQP